MTEVRANRRLAAILAADVVGYSRLMEADEAGTLAALKQHRATVFDPRIAEFQGRIVKLMGDGTLVEFSSVVDAVQCALAIQRAAKSDGAGGHSPIALRIGLNLGDIIIDRDDIYGDGVNVAARLEPLAEAGGVCISGIVKESIGSRIDVPFHDGGEVSVKNIDRPIRVWKWRPQADAATAVSEPAQKQASRLPSIAVLPFQNMSGDPEQEYFSDGITEDIITDLSKVGGLMVIARNSSFTYKGKAVDVRVVGRELGVDSVLEGSIRRAGNRVRITAQLIDAASGGHRWAERYDRDLTDIFAVQDEVTRQIIGALKVTLSAGEQARIAGSATTSLDAHDLFLKGRALGTAADIDGDKFRQALELLDRALAIDPGYAPAYAAQAFLHLLNYHNHWTDDAQGALVRADQLSAKAIASDPNEPFGYAATAVIAEFLHDPRRSTAAVERALQLQPNYPVALSARGTRAVYRGAPLEGMADIERAMRLDPVYSQQYLHFLGLAHLIAGNYETAATMFKERMLLVPQTDTSRSMLVSALGHLGEIDEARRVWNELKTINPKYVFSEHLARLPFRNKADADTIAAGMAKAGVLA